MKIILGLIRFCRSLGQLATKQDLQEMEKRITMQVQDAIVAMTNLSTAADGLSSHVDPLIAATNALVLAVQNGGTLTPEQEAAVAVAQKASTDASAQAAKVDAAVAAADQVLPTPAPAGPVPAPAA